MLFYLLSFEALVHIGQFQRMVRKHSWWCSSTNCLQYEKFWLNPQNIPVLWISQLFSMLTISAALKGNMESNGLKSKTSSLESSATIDMFTNAAAECLILADYTKPQRHLIEALFLYCQSKGLIQMDPESEVRKASPLIDH